MRYYTLKEVSHFSFKGSGKGHEELFECHSYKAWKVCKAWKGWDHLKGSCSGNNDALCHTFSAMAR